jgi:hypothetical protein
MKRVKGNFSYKNNHAPLGSTLDTVMASAGAAIASDPEQAEQAKTVISSMASDGIKSAIMDNKGLLITGLVIFGLSMAAANVFLTFATGMSLRKE